MTAEAEKTYTLRDAQLELRRQECGRNRHRPALESARPVGSIWFCECGAVIWMPAPKTTAPTKETGG